MTSTCGAVARFLLLGVFKPNVGESALSETLKDAIPPSYRVVYVIPEGLTQHQQRQMYAQQLYLPNMPVNSAKNFQVGSCQCHPGHGIGGSSISFTRESDILPHLMPPIGQFEWYAIWILWSGHYCTVLVRS